MRRFIVTDNERVKSRTIRENNSSRFRLKVISREDSWNGRPVAAVIDNCFPTLRFRMVSETRPFSVPQTKNNLPSRSYALYQFVLSTSDTRPIVLQSFIPLLFEKTVQNMSRIVLQYKTDPAPAFRTLSAMPIVFTRTVRLENLHANVSKSVSGFHFLHFQRSDCDVIGTCKRMTVYRRLHKFVWRSWSRGRLCRFAYQCVWILMRVGTYVTRDQYNIVGPCVCVCVLACSQMLAMVISVDGMKQRNFACLHTALGQITMHRGGPHL